MRAIPYLLENWNLAGAGSCAEPCYGDGIAELKRNRSCSIETKLRLERIESRADVSWKRSTGIFSTIDTFKSGDYHSRARRNGRQYKVNTISLMDLLKKYNAPPKD